MYSNSLIFSLETHIVVGPDAHILAYYQIARGVYTVDIYDAALGEVWKVSRTTISYPLVKKHNREIYQWKN